MATTAMAMAAAAEAAQTQTAQQADSTPPQAEQTDRTAQASEPLPEEKTTKDLAQDVAEAAEQKTALTDTDNGSELADETTAEAGDLPPADRSRSTHEYERVSAVKSEQKYSKKVIRQMEQRIENAESIIADMQARGVSAFTIASYAAHVERFQKQLDEMIAQSGGGTPDPVVDVKDTPDPEPVTKPQKKKKKKADTDTKETKDTDKDEPTAEDTGGKDTPTTDKPTTDTKDTPTSEPADTPTDVVTDTPTSKDTTDVGGGTGTTGPLVGDDGEEVLTETPTGEAVDLASVKSVFAGRVTTLTLDGDVKSVEIIDGPAYGNLTVNPDMSLALVLTGTTKTNALNLKVKVNYADGSSETISRKVSVEDGPQPSGWGLGDFYMLENDGAGGLVIEHGEDHRKVYVSGSKSALTKEDIAKMAGVSVKDINGRFFKENPSYGSTEKLAVDEEVGQMIWDSRVIHGDAPTSDWLLFERGYTYNDLQIKAGAGGASALNPLYFGAYGSGSDPVIGKVISIIKEGADNVVFDGLDFVNFVRALNGSNILFNDVTVTERGMNIQNVDGFTLRNSDVRHVTDDEPANGAYWGMHADRESGIFAKNIKGLLIESTFFDHNGWGPDYDYGLLATAGQPPSIYSHNVYIQGDSRDVTFRDNIVMRGAGDGAQLRSGGFAEDNIFIDNNNALLVSRGREKLGNYSLVNGNIITSGAHKETEVTKGGLTQGITAQGMLSTFLNNVVTHMANPDDAQEKIDKMISHFALYHKFDTPLYDDTIVYNWVGNETHRSQRNYQDVNTEGLDTDVLDKTTIQRLAAILTGSKKATIDDLGTYLVKVFDEGGAQIETLADQLIKYFRASFEIDTAHRVEAETLRFVPNDLGDGMRWDNRLNWTTETLPGAQPGDSVDLAGNWVVYGGTAVIKDLMLGDGGALTLTHGRLDVTGAFSVGSGGGQITIDNAGQFWVNGYQGLETLGITASGGRFANTGEFVGAANLDVSGNAQILLGADGGDFALRSGHTLKIEGADVDVGFDGDSNDTSILKLENGSTLELIASQAGFSEIREFFSGAFADTSGDPDTGIVIDGGKLKLDITDLAGGKAYAGTLLSADEITGQFSDVKVSGLNKKQDVTIMVDYDLDQVLISLSQYGNGRGKVVLDSRGDEDSARDNAAVWAEMQSFDDAVESVSIVEL